MAWSDAARAAALAARRAHARKRLYEPPKGGGYGVHMGRREMAAHLRDMRASARAHGHGYMVRGFRAVRYAGSFHGHNVGRTKLYTSVKGAHFADQGLRGTAWRSVGSRAAPAWAAKVTKFSKQR